ncbi:hypothetical protein HY251_19470 [bacterium]|nr:hypothetical protein [bacterium]
MTLSRLKEEASAELRSLAREKGAASLGAELPILAERKAPRDEEALLSLSRHTPGLGREPVLVRANVVSALERSLALELEAISKHGSSYLEEMDRSPG